MGVTGKIESQLIAEAASPKPALETDRDGKLYAVAMLESFKEEIEAGNEDGFSPHSAEAEEENEGGYIAIYRAAPQSDTLQRWFAKLHKYGSPQAVAGFYLIFADYVGSVMEGAVPDPTYYADKVDEYSPAGSVIYSHPELAAAALAKGENYYYLPGREPKVDSKAEARGKAKGKKQTTAEKKAADILGGAFLHVYSLDDFARRFKVNPLAAWTIYNSVKALCSKIEHKMSEADAELPEKHKARKVTAKVRRMLHALGEFILNAEDGSGHWSTPKDVLGIAMLPIVQAIGREIECAEIACGQEHGYAGYLDGDMSDPCQ